MVAHTGLKSVTRDLMHCRRATKAVSADTQLGPLACLALNHKFSAVKTQLPNSLSRTGRGPGPDGQTVWVRPSGLSGWIRKASRWIMNGLLISWTNGLDPVRNRPGMAVNRLCLAQENSPAPNGGRSDCTAYEFTI